MSYTKERRLPRVIVAGLAGDSGKTLVALGLIKALSQRGLRVAAFKKGPDFIDAAWLGRAAGRKGRNLDTFMMPRQAVMTSIRRSSDDCEIAIIEGNRGLFDGLDVLGSHSTGELAKLTKTPVILIVDSTKVTRTAAALVLGCMKMDPDVPIAGVVLNRVGTVRQESLIRRAITEEIGLEVVGAIPRLQSQHLPSRHLGLVTSIEHSRADEMLEHMADIVEKSVDVPAVLTLSRQASVLPALTDPVSRRSSGKKDVRIGILEDQAFSFYYPENLEALEDAGADLVKISPLMDDSLPEIDGLYAGGGFPEIYARQLSENSSLRNSLSRRISEGIPIWAECGGLMYLSRGLKMKDQQYPMVGTIPVHVEQMEKPQGHGYVEACVDSENPFFREGKRIFGHEFHYSRLSRSSEGLKTVFSLQRGVGLGSGRDGIQRGGVIASYTHLHALGVPEWGQAFVRAAEGGGR